MIRMVLLQPGVQDVPVCLPERMCVDQTPVAAPLIRATSALTPASPMIAVGCLVAAGVALVLLGMGVHLQWRRRVVARWLVISVAAILLAGLCISWVVGSRLAVIAVIYSDVFGQPAAPVPLSLIGSWPAVLSSSYAMSAAGGLALIAVVGSALLRRRRFEALM